MAVKRLNRPFSAPDLPELDFCMENTIRSVPRAFNVDFLPYARSHQSDILLSNGSVEFAAHSAILAKISPVFRDMIEGDNQAQAIILRDISDEMIRFLQKFIYAPNDCSVSLRREIKLNSAQAERDVMLLITKYDIKLLALFAAEYFSNNILQSSRNAKDLKALNEAAETYNLPELKEKVNESAQKNIWKLTFEEMSTYDVDQMVELVKSKNFGKASAKRDNEEEKQQKEALFGNIARYARNNNSREVIDALKQKIPKLHWSESAEELRNLVPFLPSLFDAFLQE